MKCNNMKCNNLIYPYTFTVLHETKKGNRLKQNNHLTDPALAFTTSVPAFWILSVSLSTSSSVNDTLGDVLKTKS